MEFQPTNLDTPEFVNGPVLCIIIPAAYSGKGGRRKVKGPKKSRALYPDI